MIDGTIGERLARVETKLELWEPLIQQTADDVRTLRDHMLAENGRKAGSWKVVGVFGSVIAGAATVGATVAAFLNR